MDGYRAITENISGDSMVSTHKHLPKQKQIYKCTGFLCSHKRVIFKSISVVQSQGYFLFHNLVCISC